MNPEKIKTDPSAALVLTASNVTKSYAGRQVLHGVPGFWVRN